MQGAFLPGLCEVEFEPGTLASTEAMSTEATSTEAMSTEATSTEAMADATAAWPLKVRISFFEFFSGILSPSSVFSHLLRYSLRLKIPLKFLLSGPKFLRILDFFLRCVFS